MPGYNSQRRGTARTSQIFIVMCVPFSVFCVLFVCKCVLYYCHRVSTQFQLKINNNNNMGVGGQLHAPAALPPGKTRYRLYRRLGGPQSQSGREWNISPHRTGIRSPYRPARSRLLYRLSHPAIQITSTKHSSRTVDVI
jgi:hypothetical protein